MVFKMYYIIQYFTYGGFMNIVIFGATGGIGKCLSYELSKKHNLFLGSRYKDKIEKQVLDISRSIKFKQSINGSDVDVRHFTSIEKFINESNDFLGSIDIIINCIGSLLLKPPHLIDENDIEDVYKVNVFSCYGILKHSFKFLKNNGGSIIFFSSAASSIGLKNHECISGAKAAISSIVSSASSTYSRYNIRLNAIAPGLVETPMTEKIVSSKIALDYSKKLHALNRIGTPQNFIPIINSLLDERSDWITGQTFIVDGGLSSVK